MPLAAASRAVKSPTHASSVRPLLSMTRTSPGDPPCIASRKTSTLPKCRAGATRPLAREPGTTGARPGGATRSGTEARRHASASSGVDSSANALAISRLSTARALAPPRDSRARRQTFLDLARVIEVVSGHQRDHLLERQASELRVRPPAFQLLARDAVDELDVRAPEREERLQRTARVDAPVARVPRPRVLIHADERDAASLVDGAQAVAPEHLDLGQVRQDLARRPLARRGPGRQPAARGPAD